MVPQTNVTQSQAVALPPQQEIPAELPLPTKSPTAAIAPSASPPVLLENDQLPTAIARGLEAAFPTPEHTVTPVPSPTRLPCTKSGQIVTGTYPSEIAGSNPYRIYLPPCYGEEKNVYPALYMLPGNIHTNSVWDDLGLDDAAEAAIKRGDIPPMLIVMAPGGHLSNFTSGGPWSYESMIMDELIPFIENNYCVWRDPAGRAIGGMSRGGYWSLEIAFRNADQFASVGGHSASLYDLYGGPDVIPQSTGLTNDLGDLRIYFDVGENDWVIPNLRKLHEDMEEAGIDHEWVVNDGWHENDYWASHTRDYITWYSEPWPMQREAYPTCTIEKAAPSP